MTDVDGLMRMVWFAGFVASFGLMIRAVYFEPAWPDAALPLAAIFMITGLGAFGK